MLWRPDRKWGRTMHVTGNNIRTNTQIKFLTKKQPITHSASLLSVPNNSVTECMNVRWSRPPPQSICASHTIWTLMEWKCFLLTYTNSSCDGAFIALCVQSIAPITLGSRFILRFNVGLFNCIVGIWYTCWDADNSVPLGWHGLAQGRLAQSQLVGQLPLECPGC